MITETGRKVLGMSSGQRKVDIERFRRVSTEKLARKRWDSERTEENRLEYRGLG